MALNEANENKIIEFLKKRWMGASSTEIAKAVGMSRPTLIKYLGIMKVQGMVDYKSFGMAKVWHIPQDVELSDLLADKDVIKVLKRSKDTGGITLFGRPRTIIPSRFIQHLTTMLDASQQQDIFRKITLVRIQDYEKATDAKLDESSPREKEEFIRDWVNYRLSNGWGRLESLKLDAEKKTLKVSLSQSEVADAVKKYSPKPPKEPACHLLAGIFLGFMEGVFAGTKFSCKEAKCRILGNPTCEFLIQSL